MKKALVTGANGFVGGALVKELIESGIEVIALDRDGYRSNLPANVRFVPHELDQSETLPERISDRDIDVFYHFAWAGSAGAARADTALQLRNAQWTVDCLRAAKAMNCKKFVCAGSIMEHETVSAAYRQGNKPGLGYIYGSGKLVAHTMCASVAADVGIDLVWAKITNAYGVGELSPRFVNTTIRKILAGEQLQFTAGTQNYDFVYIDDVARAFRLIGAHGKPFCHYLIGSSNAKPLREFILEMKAALAPDRDFIFGDVPFTGVNLPLEEFDCSLTEGDTGFKAEVPFSEGVRRTMEWLKAL
ncbi:MAG: NAD(P)-dependent oxidoreductase [Bacteroides sp.]|nr:NAD(P)-dependent oxidoreductase [Eubacterium sp.]MCM1417969.1 NAD(P)-dependent oxidoreductase [Roseburia sp.]MCM1461784.1 NAD(P)-dependent oxidoreductase [Bacteroides sp.]